MTSTSTSTSPSTRRPARRQGTTLVVTMIVIAAVASILAVTSQQFLGMHALSGSHLITQANAYTAEGCAGMVEGFLFTAANNDPALVQDIAPSQATVNAAPTTYTTNALKTLQATWNNYAGYMGPVSTAITNQASWPTMWIGNCMVTWRIEPLTIWDSTFTSTIDQTTGLPTTPPTAGNNTVNYNALLPTSGSIGNVLNNPGYFQYRLVVTSYYVDLTVMAKNGQTMANATPWATPGEALSVIQCQRQIQLRLLNLFQYVIFYAAVGPAGDIEFHPGGALTINGAVHSNGAIYFGGTSLPALTGPTTDFHSATCQSGQILVGTSANPVGIDAPDGIFRQQKDANVAMALEIPATNNTGGLSVLSPLQVPLRGGSINGTTMSSTYDLNGDTDVATMTKVMLNGNQLISTNDSRSGLKLGGAPSTFIRDIKNGAGVVSLSNFPDLKGYAFEPQSCVPAADTGKTTQVYWKGLAWSGVAQTWNQYEFTINPQVYLNAQALYYPGAGQPPTAAVTSYPVYATDMPLWNMASPAGGTILDIWPTAKYVPGYYNYALSPSGWNSYANTPVGTGPASQPYWPKVSINKGTIVPTFYHPVATPTSPSPLDSYLPEVLQAPNTTWYSGMPAEGHYFSNTLHGAAGSTTTGITIRERGAPNLLFTFDLVCHPPSTTIGPFLGLPQQGQLIMSDTPPFWCAPDCSQAQGTGTNVLWGAEFINAYAAMMMSKYVVYFGTDVNGDPFDITIPFFRSGLGQGGGAPVGYHGNPTTFGNVIGSPYYALSAAESSAPPSLQQVPSANGLIATTDLFVNVREGAWLENNRYLSSVSSPTPATYRVDALTLNIGQICSFIAGTPSVLTQSGGNAIATWGSLTANAQQTSTLASSTLLANMFSGVVYAHRTHRTLTPLGYGAPGSGVPYVGCPWQDAFPASDNITYGENPPPPPPTPTAYGSTLYSPQGAAGVPISAGYAHYLSYPCLNGYTTLFLPPYIAYEDNNAVADHMLPIYDPVSPLGYTPLETWNTNGFYKTPATLVTTMNLGTNFNCMYPVFGTTTPNPGSNGGVVGVGTAATLTPPAVYPARVGGPYVWSVYPSPLSVRLFNGVKVNWGGVQPAANSRPQGLTVITPNTGYIQGDYNTKTYNDASGTAKITPCAFFCDGLTTLSNAWTDTGTTATYTGGVVNATSTSYIVSVMINNQPTDFENTPREGSDGTHNVIRYAENWGTGPAVWTFQGSLVVLNRTRYGRSYVPGSQPNTVTSPFNISSTPFAATTAGSFYGVPSRVYQFNSDLLTQAGIPPDGPHAITATRVVSTINTIDH